MMSNAQVKAPNRASRAIVNVGGAWFLGIDDHDPFGGRFVTLDGPPAPAVTRPTPVDPKIVLPLVA